MSAEYSPTPDRQLPALGALKRWHCPKCLFSADEAPRGPIEGFCPVCLARYLRQLVPQLVETTVARPVLPSAQAVTDRLDAISGESLNAPAEVRPTRRRPARIGGRAEAEAATVVEPARAPPPSDIFPT